MTGVRSFLLVLITLGAACSSGSPGGQANPSCSDGRRNGAETDVDCGGGDCAPCIVGRACAANGDCASALCLGHSCVAPACPAPLDLPVGAPRTDYALDGRQFWPLAAGSWSWTVTGGACDGLLASTAGEPTFDVSGATSSQFVLRPLLPGDYAVHMVAQTDVGPATCDFPVRIRASGLRAVLCWDTTGAADLDLHVHRSGSTTPWFTTTESNSTRNPDDCYYETCKCNASTVASWGYAASSTGQCNATPEQTCWVASGCRNPRLELDNVNTAGIPEVVALDSPQDGESYRVMAHYYTGSVTTHPIVSIFCGDAGLVASFGVPPDTVSGFSSGGGFGTGPMWRVADVAMHVTSGTTTGCTVTPLHPAGASTGYSVTTSSRAY